MESHVSVSPVQWAALKDIDQVLPLNAGDAACLLEIRAVLKKHGQLTRFGIALLHSHFELEADEIMLESTDDANRTLTTVVVKQAEAGSGHTGTVWMLGEGPPATMAWCRKFCQTGFFGHTKRHNEVPGK